MLKPRTLGIAMALVLGATPLVMGIAACSGEAQLQVGTAPPPAPPPPADTDGDGIPDNVDKCVDQKEDGLPPDAKDGCPSDDPDKDGIKGTADKCPMEPETVNDFEDEDGCPDTKPMVEVRGSEIRINDKIMFAKASADIDSSSNTLIENIANVMKQHADIDFVEIAGHASNEGDANYNKNLTKRRAQAVLDALAKLGVDRNRMRAAGYGFYCPLDAGESADALEKNRRVEFKILRRAGKDTGVAGGGCEAADAKGLKPAGIPATAPKTEAADAK